MMLAYATCLNREHVPWLEPNSQHQFGLSQAGFLFLFLFRPGCMGLFAAVVQIRTNELRFNPGHSCLYLCVSALWGSMWLWNTCILVPSSSSTVPVSFGVKCGQMCLCETWLTNQSRALGLVWWVLSWSRWATFWQAAGAGSLSDQSSGSTGLIAAIIKV